ncbi:MAG: hypothetical protein R3E53_23305, partial [Myxococcota bacterium]
MRATLAILALAALAALPSCADQDAPAAPLRLAKTIPLEGVTGRFDHLALDESTDVLYVVALGNDTLEVVDLGRGERTRTIRDLPRPTGIAIDQRSGRFAVASSGD